MIYFSKNGKIADLHHKTFSFLKKILFIKPSKLIMLSQIEIIYRFLHKSE